MFVRSRVKRIRATVKILRLHCLHTLCCVNKNTNKIIIPPSCTTHHRSTVPSRRSLLSGYVTRFLATSRASWRFDITRKVSEETIRHIRGTVSGYFAAAIPALANFVQNSNMTVNTKTFVGKCRWWWLKEDPFGLYWHLEKLLANAALHVLAKLWCFSSFGLTLYRYMKVNVINIIRIL